METTKVQNYLNKLDNLVKQADEQLDKIIKNFDSIPMEEKLNILEKILDQAGKLNKIYENLKSKNGNN